MANSSKVIQIVATEAEHEMQRRYAENAGIAQGRVYAMLQRLPWLINRIYILESHTDLREGRQEYDLELAMLVLLRKLGLVDQAGFDSAARVLYNADPGFSIVERLFALLEAGAQNWGDYEIEREPAEEPKGGPSLINLGD